MNPKRLFVASCFALIATAMAFSIRADIIPALKTDFGFTGAQMGLVAGTGLWGFAITIVLGGMLVDAFGMGRLMAIAFLGHVSGVFLTIFAQGFTSLYVATLLIGLANGLVEAVINPLAATLYPTAKTKHLNVLHAWWPGGLIIGGLMGFALTKLMALDAEGVSLAALSLGWKIKMLFVLIPTFIYGFLLLGQKFPETERVATGVSYAEMWREAFRPMLLVFIGLMVLTAATELGPDQWVGNLLQNLVGIQGVLLLVYTAGIMFVLRFFFSGVVVSKLGPLGVLIASSALSAVGLYALSSAQTALTVFAAATIFGMGKTYFWPTMLGVVSERFPKGGALVMALMGGAGMFSAGFLMVHAMGSIQDYYAVKHLSPQTRQLVVTGNGLDEKKALIAGEVDASVRSEVEAAKQYSAVMTYRWVAAIPAFLVFAFTALYLYFRAQGGYQAVSIDDRRRHGMRRSPLPA
ncbi:MAG: MFS transporter [Bdellovibrionota bacterium]